MKAIKKYLCFVLCLLLVLSMVACAAKQEGEQSTVSFETLIPFLGKTWQEAGAQFGYAPEEMTAGLNEGVLKYYVTIPQSTTYMDREWQTVLKHDQNDDQVISILLAHRYEDSDLNTRVQKAVEDLYIIKERLTAVYGEPVVTTLPQAESKEAYITLFSNQPKGSSDGNWFYAETFGTWHLPDNISVSLAVTTRANDATDVYLDIYPTDTLWGRSEG